jgi:hypothetical protein
MGKQSNLIDRISTMMDSVHQYGDDSACLLISAALLSGKDYSTIRGDLASRLQDTEFQMTRRYLSTKLEGRAFDMFSDTLIRTMWAALPDLKNQLTVDMFWWSPATSPYIVPNLLPRHGRHILFLSDRAWRLRHAAALVGGVIYNPAMGFDMRLAIDVEEAERAWSDNHIELDLITHHKEMHQP